MSPEKDHHSLLARALLTLERATVYSPRRSEEISRREFLRKARETARWIGLLAAASAAGWLVKGQCRRLQREAEEEEIIWLSPEIKRELKLGPNGEELYFWGPETIFWMNRADQRTSVINRTDNLFLAFNHKAFGEFLREEKISLKNVGTGEFVIDSKVIKSEGKGENFLEESQNISAFIAASLFCRQKEGKSFLQSDQSRSLFARERERFLSKFVQFENKESLPFSLWKEPLR